MDERFHLMGLKDGAWHILATSTDRAAVEVEYDYWEESCKQQTPMYPLVMVVQVL